jgi:hypothetical protein
MSLNVITPTLGWHGLEKVQYQPGLVEGRLGGTGLALGRINHRSDTTE